MTKPHRNVLFSLMTGYGLITEVTVMIVSASGFVLKYHLNIHDVFSDKGTIVAPAEAAAPAAAAPVKRLDNLFFIEEPQNVSVVESKWTPGHKAGSLLSMNSRHSRSLFLFCRGYSDLHR